MKPEELRAILMKTARDLGAPGRDDLFGAGEADAYAAVSAVVAAPAMPVAAVSDAPAAKSAPDRQDVPATRALEQPAATMASDKPADGEPNPPRNKLAARLFCRRKMPVKKVKSALNVSAPPATYMGGSGNPSPTRLYSARAPIHPKRPYSLTRPVVPPDGSFVSGDISRA